MQVVVVGGGYIGMETAAALSLWGLPVTMVFPEEHLMQVTLEEQRTINLL